MASATAEVSGDALTAPEAALAQTAQHAALRRRARHHAMLAALSGSAPAFPAAAKLASRWLAAHMLSNHITEPITELLTAAVFSADQSRLPGRDLLPAFYRQTSMRGHVTPQGNTCSKCCVLMQAISIVCMRCEASGASCIGTSKNLFEARESTAARGNDDRLIRATDDLKTRIKMVEFLDLSHISHSAHALSERN